MAKKVYKPVASLAELKAVEAELKALPGWEKMGQVIKRNCGVGYKAMAYLLAGHTAEDLDRGV